jgi:cytoskeletal protein CcmA (bactofilin family)
MFGRSATKLETVIGDDSTVKGEMAVRGTVRIDGCLEGDVRADWVVVGETGRVRGNVKARAVVVGGRVEGNIEGSEIVELKDKAQVSGEICAAKLSITEGALFEGNASMKKRKEAAEGQEGKIKPLTATRSAS